MISILWQLRPLCALTITEFGGIPEPLLQLVKLHLPKFQLDQLAVIWDFQVQLASETAR